MNIMFRGRPPISDIFKLPLAVAVFLGLAGKSMSWVLAFAGISLAVSAMWWWGS